MGSCTRSLKAGQKLSAEVIHERWLTAGMKFGSPVTPAGRRKVPRLRASVRFALRHTPLGMTVWCKFWVPLRESSQRVPAAGPSFTGITRAEEERIPSTIGWRLNISREYREYFMTTDPVCGMKVDDQNPQHQTQYGAIGIRSAHSSARMSSNRIRKSTRRRPLLRN